MREMAAVSAAALREPMRADRQLGRRLTRDRYWPGSTGGGASLLDRPVAHTGRSVIALAGIGPSSLPTCIFALAPIPESIGSSGLIQLSLRPVVQAATEVVGHLLLSTGQGHCAFM